MSFAGATRKVKFAQPRVVRRIIVADALPRVKLRLIGVVSNVGVNETNSLFQLRPNLQRLLAARTFVLCRRRSPRWPSLRAAPPQTPKPIYAAARPRLLQIRTVVDAAGRQCGPRLGLSRQRRRARHHQLSRRVAIRARAQDLPARIRHGRRRRRASSQLLAIDVANDLALVRIDRSDTPFFTFAPRGGRRRHAQGRAALLDGQSARSRLHHRRRHL